MLVVVSSLAGEEVCSFRSRQDSTWSGFIATLECALKEQLHDGHVLIHDRRILGGRTDDDFLGNRCRSFLATSTAGESVQLTLVFQARPNEVCEATAMLWEAIAELKGSPVVRNRRHLDVTAVRALDTLAFKAHRGDSESIDAVCACFEHCCEHFSGSARQRAVQALGRIAGRRDKRVIDALLPRLGDMDCRVRVQAASVLGQMAEKGDQRAIDRVVSLLGDTHSWVRDKALVVLQQVAVQGDGCAIDVVATLFSNPSSFVRADAVWALRRLAQKGDRRAIDAISPLLRDADASVRREARSAITDIAGGFDSFFIQAAAILRCGAMSAVGQPARECSSCSATCMRASGPSRAKATFAVAFCANLGTQVAAAQDHSSGTS